MRVVFRDRAEAPAPRRYGVCYLNAFQTQPHERAWWMRRHPRLILRAAGRPVGDPGWPGELLLDVSTPDRRRELAGVWRAWMRGCARRGYRAVDPDNLDSWTRSRGLLTPADAVAAARLLVREARRAGLAAGQKNAAEIARPLRAMGFDFAVAEECEAHRECGAYTRVYGRRVFEVEYPSGAGDTAFTRACAARGGRIAVLLRDRGLVPPRAVGHVERRCG